MKIDKDMIIMIIIGVVALIIVIMVLSSIIKSRKEAKNRPSSSILDIDIDGVDEDKTFEFGYEKEDTIVMEQVKEEKPKKKPTTKKKTTKKETKKK